MDIEALVWEDLCNDYAHDRKECEYTEADAIEDEYWDCLKDFFRTASIIAKEWEELNWYEIENVKMMYEKHLEDEEAITNPERHYMLESRR